MFRHAGHILYSATDLVTFHECEHASALDRAALDDPQLRAERCAADETGQLVIERGHRFEATWLEERRRELTSEPRWPGDGPAVVEIAKDGLTLEARAAATLDAMRAGAELIYQATFLDEDLMGHADFLQKRRGRRSALGDWAYEVADTKLARRPKAAHVLQLGFYGELLARAQGVEPERMHVVLGTRETVTFRTRDSAHYVRRLLRRFRKAIGAGLDPATRYPTPVDRCRHCHWRERCERRRDADDSLWRVAGIRASQVRKLEAAGVDTLATLARLPAGAAISRLAPPTLARLREQAAMQLAGRETGELQYRIVPHAPGEARGFALLPAPDEGDVYFDMEGDPLYSSAPPTPARAGEGRGEGSGLEYLFGVLHRSSAAHDGWAFVPFWGHDRAGERRAFETFMDWLARHLERHPRAHVYHYAAYEDTALKRLAGRHGTREDILDRLLRERCLVDLYKVVREGVRASTPSYSIKDIEKFYRAARAGEVQTAGASIAWYERWLDTGEPRLLEDIARYNEDDVRSLAQLHAWLLERRPHGIAWRDEEDSDEPVTESAARGQPSERLRAYLGEVAEVRAALLDGLPPDATRRTPAQQACALLADLLEFHRRCEKPQWWEVFARRELAFDELVDCVDAIAGLARVAGTSDVYEHPEQELRFEAGEQAVWLEHPQGARVTLVELDEARHRLRLKPSRASGPLPDALTLGKTGPLESAVLKQALLRVGRSLAAGENRYAALAAFLEKRLPRLEGLTPGRPIVASTDAPLEEIVDAVARLDTSYLFIQGPPGAGKTFTGARVIAALLARGKRVAVCSNSHKAINHLLAGVEEAIVDDPERWRRAGLTTLRACKKVSRGNDDSYLEDSLLFENVESNDEALSDRWQLVGGTAWLFAHADADQRFDYLFVDEAGQVALGNLAATAACARNLVLLGDQMQLAQPIQGVHPGRSGESSLEYLLDGRATVPPERGIFLPVSWRMCPDVCRFVSEAFYDGRLEPEARNANQRLVLPRGAHPALRPTGVAFWPVEHAGCEQRSPEEAEAIAQMYASLTNGSVSWIDRDGVQRTVGTDDVLVVAPYNLQVNLLKRTLPAGARVGTVDKFQGQEAAVTLISMTTSSEDDLPRNLEFLFSPNRLNVAISRARCVSVVVASPRLLDARGKSPGDIALISTLCRAGEEDAGAGER